MRGGREKEGEREREGKKERNKIKNSLFDDLFVSSSQYSLGDVNWMLCFSSENLHVKVNEFSGEIQTKGKK